jgi:hypothetical protein
LLSLFQGDRQSSSVNFFKPDIANNLEVTADNLDGAATRYVLGVPSPPFNWGSLGKE